MAQGRARGLSACRGSVWGYVLILLTACGGRGEEVSRGANPVSGPVVVSVTADAQTYARGDAIGLTLELRHSYDRALVLHFATGQRYDFTILTTEGDIVWSWSEGRMFTQALGEETVQPDQPLLYSERVRPVLPSGTFRVVGRIVARDLALADTTVIVVR